MAVTSVTVGDLVESVAFHLANATSVDATLTAEIQRNLGWALTALLSETYLPAFRTDAQITLVDGTSDYSLPDDFEAIIEPSVYYDSSPRETLLYYEEQDRIRGEWQERLSSERKPTHFTIRERSTSTGAYQLRVISTPDTTYTINYTYFAIPTPIEGDTSTATELDRRFPRNMIDGLVKGAALGFPQYLTQDQQAAFKMRFEEVHRDLKRKQDPVVGYARTNRSYSLARRPGAANSSWRSDIYTGSPGDYY